MRNIVFLSLVIFGFASCDDTNSHSEQKEMVDQVAPTNHREWSKNATIYEVNIRQHTPEGTFKAFEADIPRLKDMGIKILWLMPIHPIGVENRKGGKGSYYSVRDYKAVNDEFGTMEDFQSLVETAHANGLKVIIDWVANHTAFDNVWTQSNLEYYNLDSLGNLQPPNGTDWWDVADLNYDNPDTWNAMIDAMQFWLQDANIDGYRCDVASFVPTEFWNACRDSLERTKPDIFMLAEAEAPELQEKAFDMSYAWEFLHIMNNLAKGEMELEAIDEYMAKEDTNFRSTDYRMYFTTNHDENSWNGTVMERYGEKGHKAAAVLAFTIDGMPLVYSGQEAGMDYALKFFEKDTIEWGDYKLQEFYTALLKLNIENEALWNGEFGGDFKRIKSSSNDEIYAYKRTKGEREVVVILNLTGKEHKVTFENLPSGEYEELFNNSSINNIAENGVEMAPFDYYVFYK